MLVDTHCHLSKEDFEFIDDIVNAMDGIMISAGCDNTSNQELLQIVNDYSNVYGTLGIHPEFASSYKEEDLEFIEKHIKDKKIVGIGEIGLDYHYGNDNLKEQQELFIKQILLANKYHIPIVIHSRDAASDTLEILKKYLKTTAIIHCFSYSLEMALEFLKLDTYLGVGGVITFSNNKKLKNVVENILLDRLVLETDSPYLAPIPYRGSQNQPAYVIEVAKKIADIKNIKTDEVITKTYENAKKIFDLN